MTDIPVEFPAAPPHIDGETWIALCEHVRTLRKIEWQKLEGVSWYIYSGTFDRELNEKSALFDADELRLAAKAVTELDGPLQLGRDVRPREKTKNEVLADEGKLLGLLKYARPGRTDLTTRGYLERSGNALDDPDLWAAYLSSCRLGRVYYVFVEEVAAPDMAADVDGPTGQSVDIGAHRVFRQGPIRFRSSGLSLEAFHNIADRFEELDPEDIGREQRERRKQDLLEHLGDTQIPIFDLYVPARHPDLRALRAMLIPGSWHILAVSGSPRLPIQCPILIGEPDRPDELYAFSYLIYVGAVPAYVEIRLRDIFSLAHIPDARFNLEADERGPPPAPTKPSPPEASPPTDRPRRHDTSDDWSTAAPEPIEVDPIQEGRGRTDLSGMEG